VGLAGWCKEVFLHAGSERNSGCGADRLLRIYCSAMHKWVDPLSNEQFWRKPYPYGNSVGHLVLHMTGNLNYYIGARVAGTGYLREPRPGVYGRAATAEGRSAGSV